MAQNGLDLKQVTDAIAEARSTYEEPNIQLDPDLTFLPFVNDSSFLATFVLVSSISIGLLILAVVILGYKLHKTNIFIQAGYLAAAANLPAANAKLLTKSTTVTTPSPTTPTPSITIMDTTHYFTIFWLTFVALILYKIVLYLHKSITHKCTPISKIINYCAGSIDQAKYTSHLVLHLTNTQSHVTLSLLEVPCAENLIQDAERPQLIRVKYTKKNKTAKLTWDGPFTYSINGHPVQITLPCSVPIPLKLRSTLLHMTTIEKAFPIYGSVLGNFPHSRLRERQATQGLPITPTSTSQTKRPPPYVPTTPSSPPNSPHSSLLDNIYIPKYILSNSDRPTPP